MLSEKTHEIIRLCNPVLPKDIFVNSDWKAFIKTIADRYDIKDVNGFMRILINVKRFCMVRKYIDKDKQRRNEDVKNITKILNYLNQTESCLRLLTFYQDGGVRKLLIYFNDLKLNLTSFLSNLRVITKPGRPDKKLKHEDIINMLVLIYCEVTQRLPKCTHSNWETNVYEGEILIFIQDIASLLGLVVGSEGRICRNIKKVTEKPSMEKTLLYKRMLDLNLS